MQAVDLLHSNRISLIDVFCHLVDASLDSSDDLAGGRKCIFFVDQQICQIIVPKISLKSMPPVWKEKALYHVYIFTLTVGFLSGELIFFRVVY